MPGPCHNTVPLAPLLRAWFQWEVTMVKKRRAIRRGKPQELTRTAYHEAGHAVAGFHFGRAIEYVTIEPNAYSLGHILFKRWVEEFARIVKSSTLNLKPWKASVDLRTQARVESLVVMIFAGGIAEERFAGSYNRRGALCDERQAKTLAQFVYADERILKKYLTFLYARAATLLADYGRWDQVEAVAGHLLRVKRLSGRGLRDILRVT